MVNCLRRQRMTKRERDQADNFANRRSCEHTWQPVSFVFETELLTIRSSEAGLDIRPLGRQPDLLEGRVYCVCMKCASHTYIVTQWIGYYLGGDRDVDKETA